MQVLITVVYYINTRNNKNTYACMNAYINIHIVQVLITVYYINPRNNKNTYACTNVYMHSHAYTQTKNFRARPSRKTFVQVQARKPYHPKLS